MVPRLLEIVLDPPAARFGSGNHRLHEKLHQDRLAAAVGQMHDGI